MIVSRTLRDLCNYYGVDLTNNDCYARMREVCDNNNFDLDDFLFEIWKETLND